MQRNYLSITYAYHFICEVMIVFFLSIPIFYYYYETVPYMSFALVLVGSSVVYVQLFHRVTSYVPYMVLAPCLMVLFYLLSYPLLMSILFGVVFTWRAITLRKEHRLDNEGTYLRWILMLSVILPLFIHDLTFILFVVSVLFLLIVGNIVRNMTVLPKRDRRSKSVAFLSGVFVLVIAGVTVIAYSFHGVRTLIGWIWSAISGVLVWAGSLFVYLLSLIPMPEGQEGEGEPQEGGGPLEIPEETASSETLIDHLFTWLMIIGCIIAAYFIFRFVRKQLQKTFEPIAQQDDHITYEQMDLADERKRTWKERLRNMIPLPKDHVRKRMYQFEKRMSSTEQGRKREETIEEWVNRTGWAIDFELYQRVRYGAQQATKQEVRQLEAMIREIERDDRKE